MANAIQTMPPCIFTRISSACTCPRSRGCSTRCSCTAWPWLAGTCLPRRDRPLVKPKGDDDRLQGAAMARSVSTSVTVSAGRPQAVERRPFRCGEGLAALRTDEALVLARVDTDIALAYLASGRTRQIRAEYKRGIHDHSPLRLAGERAGVCCIPASIPSESHHA